MTATTIEQIDIGHSRSVAPARWPARLALDFCGRGDKTVLVKKRHEGPLYVQKAFYPDGPNCAHVYLLHPPGGVVSGDSLNVSLSLTDAAQVLMTTPGAARLYRARQDRPDQPPLKQRVYNRLTVAAKSQLEWLPGETIVFNGADIELITEVNLSDGCQFMGWEILCLGLPASNLPFTEGRFSQTIMINQDGLPKIIDRMQFSADSPYLQSRCGLQSQPVYGSFIAGPMCDKIPEPESMVQHVIDALDDAQCFSVTRLDSYLVIRYLGAEADRARMYFIEIWKQLRPVLMERPAIEPRIWST